MPTDSERLAALEVHLLGIREDVRAIREEEKRTRGRLHDMEKVTAGLLELQKEMHRTNERKLRAITLGIQWAGLFVGASMVALAVVNIVLHG